jgi:hypothetical protein
MSQITELASGQLTATDAVTIELVQADDHPTMVIIRWPSKASVFHPQRFPGVAESAARIFAAAVVRLAQLGRDGSYDRDHHQHTRSEGRSGESAGRRGERGSGRNDSATMPDVSSRCLPSPAF